VLAASVVIGTAGTVVSAFSSVMRTAGTVVLALFSVIGAAGTGRVCGEVGKGVWGKPGTGPLGALGGVPGFPPVIFNHPSPAAFLLTEQSWSVPDLAQLLFEGVRSGTRRRRGPVTSPQAAEGIGPGTRRAASARADAALYGSCVRSVCPLVGSSKTNQIIDNHDAGT
jgi:hypothetical protein